MNLVHENINEAIKHLGPKSGGEIEIARDNFIVALEKMDPSEIVEELFNELKYYSKANRYDIAIMLLDNITQSDIIESAKSILEDNWRERDEMRDSI